MKIERYEREGKGVFKAIKDGKEVGEMTYVTAGEDKIIIDSTHVNPDFGGQGIGKQLAMSAVEYARASGIKIIPVCSFAVKFFEKNKDVQDVKF